MKRAFVVIDVDTGAFCGMFATFKRAWERAEVSNGAVVEYAFIDGEWHNLDGED